VASSRATILINGGKVPTVQTDTPQRQAEAAERHQEALVKMELAKSKRLAVEHELRQRVPEGKQQAIGQKVSRIAKALNGQAPLSDAELQTLINEGGFNAGLLKAMRDRAAKMAGLG
jgi:hypothetical protein